MDTVPKNIVLASVVLSNKQNHLAFMNEKEKKSGFFSETALKPHVSYTFPTRADSRSDKFLILKLVGDVFELKHGTKELSKLDFNTLLHNSAFKIYFEEVLTQRNSESPHAYTVKDICKAYLEHDGTLLSSC